jgi:4-amino-4-deoxy-L-arabinose transferase-like glycosyltransferase
VFADTERASAPNLTCKKHVYAKLRSRLLLVTIKLYVSSARKFGMIKKASYALIVAACLIAPMLVAYATAPFGIGISEDSVAYITMAQGIVRGIGPVSFDGSPIPDWPPLYPFLIATIKQLFSVAYDEAARLLNIVLYPATIALSATLIKRYTGSLAMAALGAVSTAVYFPVFDMALYAFSELPFITLSLCLLVAVNGYTEQPSLARLIIAALVAALLCLTRYTGMAVVGIVALFLIIFHWRRRDALLKIGPEHCTLCSCCSTTAWTMGGAEFRSHRHAFRSSSACARHA